MVATPIGNLKDITIRALEVLSSVDVIYCEDTRVSHKLLKAYNISKQLRVYNDHSGDRERLEIAERIDSGEAVALISDAGTPLISDPGHKLVNFLAQQQRPMHSLPGPSALTLAFTLCGLPTDQVLFIGFLPSKKTARIKELHLLTLKPLTLIGYERASRVPGLLNDMLEVHGDVQLCIMRELTKKYEEVLRGTVSTLLSDERIHSLKGEVVFAAYLTDDLMEGFDLEALLTDAMSTMRVKDAVNIVAAQTGVNKRELYALALELNQDNG